MYLGAGSAEVTADEQRRLHQRPQREVRALLRRRQRAVAHLRRRERGSGQFPPPIPACPALYRRLHVMP